MKQICFLQHVIQHTLLSIRVHFLRKNEKRSLQLLANDVTYSFVLFLTQNVHFISSIPFTFGKARILQRGILLFLSSRYSLGERCVE